MARVLYVSYTGLMDPLGQSQVLQYVLALAGNHHMVLLSFEKPHNLRDQVHRERIAAQCRDAGVEWHACVWHRRPGVPATLYDMLSGFRKAVSLVRLHDVEVIHCRSYVASAIGLLVKRRTAAKLVFDMRGFWADERVEGGLWSKRGLSYRVVKRLERQLFLSADHIVSLTNAGVREISGFHYLRERMPPVSVIPTCTNLDLFHPISVPKKEFTLGYVGSAGSWYLFDSVARLVKILFERDPDAKFLVLNKDGHAKIKEHLEQAGVNLARVELREAAFEDVPEQIARMHAGVFFIKPSWSKRASCPTRMGEFLGCGKPCLANAGVGDVAEDLRETGTGIVLEELDDSSLAFGISGIIAMASQTDMESRAREAAEQRFSLDAGVSAYDSIYRALGKVVSIGSSQ